MSDSHPPPSPGPTETGAYRAVGGSEMLTWVVMTLSHIDERTKSLDAKFVKREEFAPVQKVVYGLVALILIGVFGALVALVVQQKGH